MVSAPRIRGLATLGQQARQGPLVCGETADRCRDRDFLAGTESTGVLTGRAELPEFSRETDVGEQALEVQEARWAIAGVKAVAVPAQAQFPDCPQGCDGCAW